MRGHDYASGGNRTNARRRAAATAISSSSADETHTHLIGANSLSTLSLPLHFPLSLGCSPIAAIRSPRRIRGGGARDTRRSRKTRERASERKCPSLFNEGVSVESSEGGEQKASSISIHEVVTQSSLSLSLSLSLSPRRCLLFNSSRTTILGL